MIATVCRLRIIQKWLLVDSFISFYTFTRMTGKMLSGLITHSSVLLESDIHLHLDKC